MVSTIEDTTISSLRLKTTSTTFDTCTPQKESSNKRTTEQQSKPFFSDLFLALVTSQRTELVDILHVEPSHLKNLCSPTDGVCTIGPSSSKAGGISITSLCTFLICRDPILLCNHVMTEFRLFSFQRK